MALEYQIDSLEGVDDAVKPLYKETEAGGFVLEVSGVVPKGDYDAMNQKAVDATTEAARRRKTLERVTGKLGLDDASGLDDALDGLLSKSTSPKKDDKDQQAIVDQIKAQADAEKTALQNQLNSIRTEGAKAEFKSALMAQGFGEKVADMVASSNMNKVQFDDDGKMCIMQDNGNPLAGSGAEGRATFGDFSTQLAAAMPELLTDKGKGGGGKPPASGGSPNSAAAKRSTMNAKAKSDYIAAHGQDAYANLPE